IVIGAVRHNLERAPKWLLIFDNVPRPDAVRDYLPQSATGHVLITSRNPNWGAVATPLPARGFDRAEAVSFLLNRTKQTDAAAADGVANELGDLPLALAQAGAYVEAVGITLAEYLELLRSRRAELWGEEQPAPDYRQTVATTLGLAMDRIQRESPAS